MTEAIANEYQQVTCLSCAVALPTRNLST